MFQRAIPEGTESHLGNLDRTKVRHGAQRENGFTYDNTLKITGHLVCLDIFKIPSPS